MSEKEKSLSELLKATPKAPGENVVSVVGVLAQSDVPDNMLLYLANGSRLEIEVKKVKSHTVLGNSVGHPIVRIEIDRGDLPKDAGGAHAHMTVAHLDTAETGTADIANTGIVDVPRSYPLTDLHTNPFVDLLATAPVIDYGTDYQRDNPIATYAGSDQPPWTLAENIGDPGFGGDPAFGGGLTPFSLQTQHQVPAAQVEALNNSAFGGRRTYLTAYSWTSDHTVIYRAFL